MAKQPVSNRKPVSAGTKGIVCLAVLLALILFVSCISITGMPLDGEGVNVLLSWVPVSAGSWPKSLPLEMGLGGGSYVDYSYTLAENAGENDLTNSLNTVRARLASMGEKDAKVSLKDESTVRLEVRAMDDARLSTVRNLVVMGGQFEFKDTDGNVVLTEKDVDRANVNVNRLNSTGSSFSVVMEFVLTKDGARKLAEANPTYLSVTCDGDSVSSYATVGDGKVTATVGYDNNAYNTAANLAFLVNEGAVDVTLSQKGSGKVEASSGAVLTVVVVVFFVLLACALVYLVMKGKLTGVSAFCSVWCTAVLGYFFLAA